MYIGERPPLAGVPTWRDEWPDLRFRQAFLLAASKGPERARQFTTQIHALGGPDEIKRSFASGGRFSVEAEVSGSYAASIAWKRRAGWPQDAAEEVALLASRGSAALSSAIMQGVEPDGSRPALAASAWALSAALWQCAWRATAQAGPPAPPAYAHLHGEFGLATDDYAWSRLVAGERTIVTRGFACAMAANDNSFPRPALGYHMPVVNSMGQATYEHAASDVVCFVSAPAHAGAGRSLLPADDAVYRLPPFASVTLVAVHEPGEWSVRGPLLRPELSERERRVQRWRCFEVTVAF